MIDGRTSLLLDDGRIAKTCFCSRTEWKVHVSISSCHKFYCNDVTQEMHTIVKGRRTC